MREFLILSGFFLCSVALRLCRKPLLRKCGALTMVVTTFLSGYLLSGHLALGFLFASFWLLMPLIDLLTRVRYLKLPLNNAIPIRHKPHDEFFPNARKAIKAMNEAGFEHVEDRAWDWLGMEQYARIFWHPEENAVGTVYLCEQQNAAFAFVSITSRGRDGSMWRTTNYPFSPGLTSLANVVSNHLPCRQNCFFEILKEHRAFLEKIGKTEKHLLMPDPDKIAEEFEQEMQEQLLHNSKQGLLKRQGDERFHYSRKGLAFLWWQQIKDMVRLC